MENRTYTVEVADLDPVYYREEDFVIYIDSEDDNIPTSLCVLADFNMQRFHPVQPLGLYLSTNSYLQILDVDARISNRQRITEEMPLAEIEAMLRDFKQKKELIEKDIVPLSELYPGWQAGG